MRYLSIQIIFCFAVVTGLQSFLLASENKFTAFDVNDVSFLFPIKNKKPFPPIQLKEDLGFQTEMFNKIIKFQYEDSNLLPTELPYLDAKYVGNINRWHVTSARFDSCGEKFSLSEIKDPNNSKVMFLAKREEGCEIRLRLVLQPMNLFGNPIATALHVVYKINPTAYSEITSKLQEIKKLTKDLYDINTTGLPLSLHPALTTEIKKNQTAVSLLIKKTIQTIIQKEERSNLNYSNLELVTLTLQYDIDKWRFVAGYIQNNQWTRLITDYSYQISKLNKKLDLPLGTEELSCDGNSICLFKPTIQPNKNDSDDPFLTYIFQDINEYKIIQSPGFRNEKIFLESEIIDNPNKIHFFNTNCVSCHASASLRDKTRIHQDYVRQLQGTPFVSKRYSSELLNNVINFGYWGVSPRISLRVANESMNVVTHLNQQLGLSNFYSYKKELNDFWKCLMSEDNFEFCLN